MPKQAADRADEVYEAEWAAGVCVLRPLQNVGEAQAYVNGILKTRWWKNRTGIARIELEYVPSYGYGAQMEDRRTTGKMTLGLLCMCEGFVLHELAHNARGDTDNSHGVPFLTLQIGLLERFVSSYLARRYREELHLRGLL